MACYGAALPAGPSPSREEYRLLSLLSIGLLDICDQRRALAVQEMKNHNEAMDKLVEDLDYPAWWERWFLGRR